MYSKYFLEKIVFCYILVDMDRNKFQLYFFVVFLGIILTLVFFLFRPFLTTLVVAATFAVIFKPFHERIQKLIGSPTLSALLTVLIICLIVLVPMFLFGFQIFREASHVFANLSTNSSGVSGKISEAVQDFMNRYDIGIEFDLRQLTRQALDWIVNNLGGFFSSFVNTVVNLFLFVIALFYLLRDGKGMASEAKSLSPLTERQDDRILSTLGTAINSVIKGTLFIAFIQSLLTALGFYLFGIPNPILWGGAALLASLIPNFGTSLVIVPGVLYLFLTGETGSAVGLTIWGVVAVGLVDNFLGPILIHRGMKIHPFLILLSVFGALTLFGPVGLLIGPLVLSLLFALLDIHSEIIAS